MNLFYKNYVPRIAVAILLIGVGQLFYSCSKDKGTESLGSDGGSKSSDKLQVKVLGITEDVISKVNQKASAGIKQGVKQNNVVPRKTVTFKGFDAIVSVEKDELKQSNVSIGNVTKEVSAAGGLKAEAMVDNIHYRLLLYKQDGTFVSSTPLLSGAVGEIDVAKGIPYNWYAISYNSTSDVVPEAADPDNPTLDLPGDKDVLYASGSVTIPVDGPDGNSPLGITFTHKLARVAVELNTMGMFADMNTATVSVTGMAIKKGTLNLKTGALSNLQDFTQAIDYSSFTDIEAPYKDAKVAYIYTADVTPVTSLTVTLTNLALVLDDASIRSFSTLLGATPSVFTFSLTPELGHSYRALVNLVEAPLTTGTVKWGRANLYYQAGHNPYRFQHTYVHTDNRNSYFSFKGSVPSQFGKNEDPCALVYPAGVWRQASETDFRALVGTLIGGLGSLPVTYGTVTSRGYFEYNASGTAAPYPSNKLHFNFNGEGISLGLIGGVIGIDLGTTYGNKAEIWTATPGLNLLGLAGLGAWYYEGIRNAGIPPLIPASNSSKLGVSLLTASAIGVDLLETNFKNVRCVRNLTN